MSPDQKHPNKILLTIAIPLYNKANSIKDCLLSCAQQSDLSNCEILVVDNASSDGSDRIASELVSRMSCSCEVRILNNRQTVSMYDNHNVCLRNSLGSYVLFLHADDRLDRSACETIKRKIESRYFPARYILWGHSMFSDFMYRILGCGFSVGRVFAGQFAFAPFLAGGMSPSGVCFSRDIEQFGGFLPSSHPIPASDSSSMVLWALKGYKFEMFDEIVCFRERPGTAVVSTSFSVYKHAYYDAWNNLFSVLSDHEKRALLLSAGSTKHVTPWMFLLYSSSIQPVAVLRKIVLIVVNSPVNLFHPMFWRAFVSVTFAVLNRARFFGG